MEKNSNNSEEKKSLFECSICLGLPIDPVATNCGHVFCWNCIKNWISSRKLCECPVCKSGIDQDKLIPLYSNNMSSSKT